MRNDETLSDEKAVSYSTTSPYCKGLNNRTYLNKRTEKQILKTKNFDKRLVLTETDGAMSRISKNCAKCNGLC